MRIRAANKNRRRASRRRVYQAAAAFHKQRVIRLTGIGRLDRVMDSGFVRRWRKRAAIARAMEKNV